jgi:hypothetical protein
LPEDVVLVVWLGEGVVARDKARVPQASGVRSGASRGGVIATAIGALEVVRGRERCVIAGRVVVVIERGW